MAALSSPRLGHGAALSWAGSDSLARNIMGPRLYPALSIVRLASSPGRDYVAKYTTLRLTEWDQL